MAVDESKLNELVSRMMGEVGGALGGALVIIGDKLGLYQALVDHGPLTASELAQRTSTAPRYIREWTAAQAAAGYISYDTASGLFSMTPEQAMVLADPNSPVFFPAAFELAAAMMRVEPKISAAFTTGRGVGWHEHDPILFHGTERFFRAAYVSNLVSSWIPTLDGVQARLERGIDVADVGCGHGVSTILMAQAYSKSRFTGFDYHEASIERASGAAREAGVTNVRFEKAASKDYTGRYDLIAFFDCLYDMGDPVGAATHGFKALKPGGTMMVVEPFGNDRLEDNVKNPLGRIFYSASTMICVPASLSQEVGLALGTQAGEARMFEVIKQGGFTRVRTATTTPFNRVIEARP